MEFKGELDFKKVIDTVFDKLKTDDVEDYDELQKNKQEETEVKEAMKETYDDVVKMMKNANTLEEALAHLSPERQELIKTAFDCHSFKVDIQRQTDGSVNLLFESVTGSKLSFLPSVTKLDETNYKEYDKLLVARIIFEILSLCLKFIGFGGKFSDKAVKEAIEYISNSFIAIDRVMAGVKKLLADAKKKDPNLIGADVVSILSEMFTILAGPVIRVFKILIKSLSWFQIIVIVLPSIMFPCHHLLSVGAATIAKILSMLLHAAFFIHKLVQKIEFDAITFPKQ